MGLGKLTDGSLIFKRKFRYTFTLQPYTATKPIPEVFIKTAKRPSVTIGESEINFLNGKMYIPGKAVWDEMEITLMDMAPASGQGDFSNQVLYDWLNAVYEFSNPTSLRMGAWAGSRAGVAAGTGGYGADAYIYLYDGAGNTLEGWRLEQAWPKSINFGELDYNSEDTVDITLSLRFSKVSYKSYCGGTQTAVDYGGCSGVNNSAALLNLSDNITGFGGTSVGVAANQGI